MFQLKSTADGLKSALSKADKLASEKLAVLNGILFRAEQQLLFDKGLPRRPWYKHMIYAPGFYTGYGVKTLPGIREGIEERNWNEAQTYADNLANTLLQFNVTLQKAVQIFK
jgi:N-acetylated-alpha-linked acidic dipeptidase